MSHRKVITLIYDPGIVPIRKDKKTPDGKSLWNFANLYFQPRNAMLYRVIFFSGRPLEEIAIIGLKNSILDRKNIIITTDNAVSGDTQFITGESIKKAIKEIRKKTERNWWTYEDGSKREMMAECLVPEKVSPEYISEIYVPNHEALNKIKAKIPNIRIPIIP